MLHLKPLRNVIFIAYYYSQEQKVCETSPWWSWGPWGTWWCHDSRGVPGRRCPPVCRKARRARRVSSTACLSAARCSTSAEDSVCSSSRPEAGPNRAGPSWGVWWGVRCRPCVHRRTSLAGGGQDLQHSSPGLSRVECLSPCPPWRWCAWRCRVLGPHVLLSLNRPCGSLQKCPHPKGPQWSPCWRGWWCLPSFSHLSSTENNKQVGSYYDYLTHYSFLNFSRNLNTEYTKYLKVSFSRNQCFACLLPYDTNYVFSKYLGCGLCRRQGHDVGRRQAFGQHSLGRVSEHGLPSVWGGRGVGRLWHCWHLLSPGCWEMKSTFKIGAEIKKCYVMIFENNINTKKFGGSILFKTEHYWIFPVVKTLQQLCKTLSLTHKSICDLYPGCFCSEESEVGAPLPPGASGPLSGGRSSLGTGPSAQCRLSATQGKIHLHISKTPQKAFSLD